MHPRSVFASLGAVCLLLTSSCGGAGGAAKAARPDQPTAKDALGAVKCNGASDDIEPWIIDLKADNRGALKAAMDKGVVVVSYDCKELKIIRNCSVRGGYAYTGTGFNEDTLRLTDTDSVKATLSGGAALAASMEADMKRGTKLDIAYAVVGESNTTLPNISRDQLGAECKGATHFVATASLGAFVMRSSTDAKVAAAAEVFGQGASAASTSSSSMNSNSGKRTSCQKATSQDQQPLADCDFPLKVRLVPITEGGGAGKATAGRTGFLGAGGRAAASCEPGTVRSGLACVSEKSAQHKVCKAAEPSSCEEECKKGSGPSCAIAGYAYEKGKGVSEDITKAMQLYEAGCGKKDLDACTGMGFLLSKGEGVAQDKKRAETIFREACDKGNGRACSGIGHQLRLAGDMNGAIDQLERACKLNYARACFYAGALVRKGGKDQPRALKNYASACTSGDLRGCLAEFVLLQSGPGANQGESISLRDKALKGLEEACDKQKDGEACETLGDYYMGDWDKAIAKPENVAKAAGYYGNACGAGVDDACMSAARIYEKGAPPYIPKNKDMAKAATGLYTAACYKGNLEGCKKAGVKPPAGIAVKAQTKK